MGYKVFLTLSMAKCQVRGKAPD